MADANVALAEASCCSAVSCAAVAVANAVWALLSCCSASCLAAVALANSAWAGESPGPVGGTITGEEPLPLMGIPSLNCFPWSLV